MRARIAVALASWIIGVAGCAPTAAIPADDAAVSKAAKDAAFKRLDDYVAAAREDKLAELGDYWSDSAKVFEPETLITGRAAMMAMITDVMKKLKLVAVRMSIDETFVHDHGTVVYQFGSIDETIAPRDGRAAPTTTRMHFVFRWAKQADGVWRIERLMETPMPPVAGPVAEPTRR